MQIKSLDWVSVFMLCLFISCKQSDNMTHEEIKTTIINTYVHGAFNETDIEAFRAGFHPQFAILNPQVNGSLFSFTKEMWEEVLKSRLKDPGFDYKSIALKPRFRTIDVEKDKASVTMDLLLDTKVVYTDFLLLMRMSGKWKIVSKVYHEH